MFEDSLVESAGRLKTKKWPKIVTFVGEALLVGFLVLLPLLITEALPAGQLNAFLVAPPPPPPPPPPAPPQIQHIQHVSEIVNGELRTPSKIPKNIQKIVEDEAPAPNTGVTGGVVGGVPGGSVGGVLGGIVGSSAPPPPPVARPERIRVSSGVAEGQLSHRVEPTYPQMARIAHIQGDVVLQATISKSGNIENLHAISGHPILQQAAMEAVKQWKYRPYLLNQEPVEIETTITVKFHM